MFSMVIWLYLNVSTIVQYQDWKHGFELANQCFAHRHWTSLLLKQLFIKALNEVLDSQFLCIHDLTKDSLDCLLTKQCKLKPMGNVPILAAEICIAFKMHGETTCCARLVHPIHWGIISSEPAHLAHPRVQVRPAMQEFYGPAQCLELPKLDHKYICIHIL